MATRDDLIKCFDGNEEHADTFERALIYACVALGMVGPVYTKDAAYYDYMIRQFHEFSKPINRIP